MNKENLYGAVLRMVKDKFKMDEYDINEFNKIYNSFPLDSNINKNVLITINENLKVKTNNTNTNTNTIIDNDVLNNKIREMELLRKSTTPSIEIPIINEYDNINKQQPIYIQPQPQPQLQTLQKFKTFVINSINRDWSNNPNRNNIQINIPININDYYIYPDCLCLHEDIREITPYIIMNISDNIKNYQIIFICSIQNGNWDIWRPSNDSNFNIDLNKKIWTLTLYDHNNQELSIGRDNIPITEINNHNNNYYKFKLENDYNLYKNDMITIKLYNGTKIKAKIINIIDNNYIINKNNIKIEEFINSHILNDMKQFSFIAKYIAN